MSAAVAVGVGLGLEIGFKLLFSCVSVGVVGTVVNAAGVVVDEFRRALARARFANSSSKFISSDYI